MMRLLFVLLLLANLALAAYWYNGVHRQNAVTASPQLHAEQIHLLSAAEVASALAAASAVSPVAATPAAQPVAVCMQWDGLSARSADLARAQLQSAGVGGAIDVQSLAPSDAKHWVYMPPQGSRANAEKKIHELEALGVTEYHLEAGEGKWQWAISLGVFSNEERAQKFLEELRQKGVRSARMGPRDAAITSVTLRFNVPDDSWVDKLVSIRQQFAGSNLRAVECK